MGRSASASRYAHECEFTRFFYQAQLQITIFFTGEQGLVRLQRRILAAELTGTWSMQRVSLFHDTCSCGRAYHICFIFWLGQSFLCTPITFISALQLCLRDGRRKNPVIFGPAKSTQTSLFVQIPAQCHLCRFSSSPLSSELGSLHFLLF